MAYWLFKSEPNCYSFADLLAEPDRTTGWDGVRNFQARNFLRDDGPGRATACCSITRTPIRRAIAGIAEVVRAGHPDPTAFDPQGRPLRPEERPGTARPGIRSRSERSGRSIRRSGCPSSGTTPALAGMELLRKGSRLSVQPVTTPNSGTRSSSDRRSKRDASARRRAARTQGTAAMPRIEHFAIYADDPTALKDFYVDALGPPCDPSRAAATPPGFSWPMMRGMALEVLGRPTGSPERQPALGLPPGVLGRRLLGEKAELERRGSIFETETFVNNDEMKTAFFKDPGGNRCQIVWRRRALGS